MIDDPLPGILGVAVVFPGNFPGVHVLGREGTRLELHNDVVLC